MNRMTRQWLGMGVLGLCLAGSAYAQDKDKLFDGVDVFSKGASNSTDVTLDKSMMGMAAAMKGQMGDLAGKMDFVSVHTYEYPKAGMYNMADVDRITKRLDGDSWHHMVREHSDKDTTDVCVKMDSEGQPSEMVVVDAEPQEVNFVHLKGHFTMADLKHFGAGNLGAVPDPKLSQRPQ
jgi:hypothetical protein